MVINGIDLVKIEPLTPFYSNKMVENGVSYGLSEAGYDIRIRQAVALNPTKKFVLASTVEYFTMPENIVAVVHDKSTWARQGLSVFNTVIEPGWRGYLTLELVYHGNDDLFIPAGSGIAQVLFHQLSGNASYGGKYQNQPDCPVEAKFT